MIIIIIICVCVVYANMTYQHFSICGRLRGKSREAESKGAGLISYAMDGTQDITYAGEVFFH